MIRRPTRSLHRVSAACATVLMLFAGAAPAAGDKSAYDSARSSAKATYESAARSCDAMNGNAKDICVAQAKAARVRTDAEAEAAYKNTPKAREHAREEIAEADYKVAKERCDDLKGNAEDVCEKQAKAMLTRAKADAKADLKTSDARKDAAEDKMKADYKVAAERCDALSGDAKSACMQQAKARYQR